MNHRLVNIDPSFSLDKYFAIVEKDQNNKSLRFFRQDVSDIGSSEFFEFYRETLNIKQGCNILKFVLFMLNKIASNSEIKVLLHMN